MRVARTRGPRSPVANRQGIRREYTGTAAVLFALALVPAAAAIAPPASQPARAAYQAVVVPRRSVLAAAPRDGTLATVAVCLGDRVRAGDRLATLDAEALRLDLAAAEAALREAESQREQAVISLAKAEDFLERVNQRAEVFAEGERKDARFQRDLAAQELRVSQARIEQRQAGAARLRDLLARSDVLAPFDGVVAERARDPGATVTQGTPLLRVITPDELIVRFAVPPAAALRLHSGQAVRFRPREGSPDDDRGRSPGGTGVAARIEHIAPEVDAALQRVIIEASLTPAEAAAARIQPGTEGRVDAPQD